jgi:hypothetical protein
VIVAGTAVRARLRSGEHRMWNLLIIEDAKQGLFFHMPEHDDHVEQREAGPARAPGAANACLCPHHSVARDQPQ